MDYHYTSNYKIPSCCVLKYLNVRTPDFVTIMHLRNKHKNCNQLHKYCCIFSWFDSYWKQTTYLRLAKAKVSTDLTFLPTTIIFHEVANFHLHFFTTSSYFFEVNLTYDKALCTCFQIVKEFWEKDKNYKKYSQF